MSKPQTIPEWSAYILTLSGDLLFSKTIAANTQGFARMLLSEGLTMGDVEQIMLMFVRQLRKTGLKLPEGGAFDLVNMGLTDPIARRGETFSEEEVRLLEVQNPPPDGRDDMDEFEELADLD